MKPAAAPATESRAGGRSDRKLGLRLATTAVLLPALVVTIVIGRWLFLAAVLAISAAMASELFLLSRDKPYRPRYLPGILLALSFPALFYWTPADLDLVVPLLVAALVGIAIAQMLDTRGEEAIAAVAFTVFGALYVGILAGHLIRVREIAREFPELPYWSGAVLLGFPILLTWINDTGAYFIGRRWGRHRLAPRVSPGKSVEGAVGGGLASLVAALVAVPAVHLVLPIFEAADALAIGFLVAVAAPFGDLVESSFKRDAGVKDVSRIVPGHGGVLDRFDSVLVVVPLYYFYLRGVIL